MPKLERRRLAETPVSLVIMQHDDERPAHVHRPPGDDEGLDQGEDEIVELHSLNTHGLPDAAEITESQLAARARHLVASFEVEHPGDHAVRGMEKEQVKRALLA